MRFICLSILLLGTLLTLVEATKILGNPRKTDPEAENTTYASTIEKGLPNIRDDGKTWKHPLQGRGLLVTNTNDDGANSLRDAILNANANPGPDTISFAIPNSDPGFDSGNGVWTIEPLSELPIISADSLFIDGASQASFIGSNTNPEGPEIVINGSQAGSAAGFFIFSSGNAIDHLVINGFASGVRMNGTSANSNTVSGCFLGTDFTGTVAIPNNIGVYVDDASDNLIGGLETEQRNIISGNNVYGILLTGMEASGNRVLGNYVGLDKSGTADLGNKSMGISIEVFSHENRIGGSQAGEGNVISGNDNDGIRITGRKNVVIGNIIGTDISGATAIGNTWDGIAMWGGGGNIIGAIDTGEGNVISGNQRIGISFSNSDSNQVVGNYIGTDLGGTTSVGNFFSGISLSSGSSNNIIGPGNVISANGLGVFVNLDSTVENTIMRNSITQNSGPGIDNRNGGNTELGPPDITGFSAGIVSGSAPPNATVEIFSDADDEGGIYEGTVTADGGGNFSWAGSPVGPLVTATATDANGNTSEFSAAQTVTSVDRPNGKEIPKRFSLSQNYPNPFNPGTTITFSLPKQARAKLQIFDLAGRELASLLNEVKSAGEHSIVFNGFEIPSGVYFYRLHVEEAGRKTFTQTRKLTLIK